VKKRWLLTAVIIGLFACVQNVRAESANRLGVGVNYWTMLDDIDVHNIDKNGFSWLATYQYKPAALLKVEADLEMFQKGFQGIDSAVYAPEAYLVLGSTIYGAAGVGILYADSSFAHDPFYALRAGLDLEILPQFYLDLNVNYRFTKWANTSAMAENINADTMLLGAALRFAF
jgi:hypothetical protein